MEQISIFPYSTKRKSRIVFLAFNIIAGILILAAAFFYFIKNDKILIGTLYIIWGSLLIIFYGFMFFPSISQRVHYSITNEAITFRKEMITKEYHIKWSDIKEISISKNYIKIITEKGKTHKLHLPNLSAKSSIQVKETIAKNFKEHQETDNH